MSESEIEITAADAGVIVPEPPTLDLPAGCSLVAEPVDGGVVVVNAAVPSGEPGHEVYRELTTDEVAERTRLEEDNAARVALEQQQAAAAAQRAQEAADLAAKLTDGTATQNDRDRALALALAPLEPQS